MGQDINSILQHGQQNGMARSTIQSAARTSIFDNKRTVARRDVKSSSSIERVMREQEGSSNNGPTTSVGRIGQSSNVSTSVAHTGEAKYTIYGNGEISDEVRDYNRYQHIRSMIRARKQEEAKAVRSAGKESPDFFVKTGSSMRTSGRFGIRHRLSKMKMAKRSTYSNLSSKDLDYFADEVIKPRAKAVGRGVGFGRSAKLSMKHQIEKDRKSGRISHEDAKDFRKIIDSL